MGKLSATPCEIGDLPKTVKAEMFALFARYYDDVCPENFTRDLAKKDGVILLYDANGLLRGFSSYLTFGQIIDGVFNRFVFSGDTIIDHHYWGDHALAFAWLRLTGSLKRQGGLTPLYWFLIVKGYRTYRYLPVFAKRFYPSADATTPKHIRRIMDVLGADHFGDQYDPQSGVVHFKTPQGRLKVRWQVPPANKTNDPSIKFFQQSNPSHTNGDELVCITELAAENMPPLAARIFAGTSQ